MLEIPGSELHALGASPEPAPTSDGPEYRLWPEKTQFDTTDHVPTPRVYWRCYAEPMERKGCP
jgi:hypothetical protein